MELTENLLTVQHVNTTSINFNLL